MIEHVRNRAVPSMVPPLARAKRTIDEYFFGGTPSLADAVWFYGFIVFATIMTIVSGTLYVLQ